MNTKPQTKKLTLDKFVISKLNGLKNVKAGNHQQALDDDFTWPGNKDY